MVIDINGKERTDTDGILVDMVKGTCALTPMGGVGDALGGYKGYGWATGTCKQLYYTLTHAYIYVCCCVPYVTDINNIDSIYVIIILFMYIACSCRVVEYMLSKRSFWP